MEMVWLGVTNGPFLSLSLSLFQPMRKNRISREGGGGGTAEELGPEESPGKVFILLIHVFCCMVPLVDEKLKDYLNVIVSNNIITCFSSVFFWSLPPNFCASAALVTSSSSSLHLLFSSFFSPPPLLLLLLLLSSQVL